ncbi:hypothetical protein L7F22_004550 [Adiantum nelumboides]|nr:hypothetical protein [Adiantum nelumboides]
MVVTSPSPRPLSTEVVYSKIGAASFASLEYASGKPGHDEVQQHSKFRAFCAGYGGRALACAVALLAICLLVIFLLQSRHDHTKGGTPGPPLVAPTTSPSPLPESSPPPAPSSSKPAQALSLSSLCNTTEHTELCMKTLSAFPSTHSTAALQDLTAFVVKEALEHLNETYMLALNLSRIGGGSGGEKAVLQDCLDLLDEARDGLHDSIDRLSHLDQHEDEKVMQGQVMDVRVWMSSSYTKQDTCWDEFEDVEGNVKEQLLMSGQPIAPLISTGLSIAKVLEEVGLSAIYALQPSPP